MTVICSLSTQTINLNQLIKFYSLDKEKLTTFSEKENKPIASGCMGIDNFRHPYLNTGG